MLWQVRIQLTTLGLWDLRAASCATATLDERRNGKYLFHIQYPRAQKHPGSNPRLYDHEAPGQPTTPESAREAQYAARPEPAASRFKSQSRDLIPPTGAHWCCGR